VRVNQRNDPLPLPFLVMGHVRMVAEWQTNTTLQYLMRLARYANQEGRSMRQGWYAATLAASAELSRDMFQKVTQRGQQSC
jgi:hypothetical protein